MNHSFMDGTRDVWYTFIHSINNNRRGILLMYIFLHYDVVKYEMCFVEHHFLDIIDLGRSSAPTIRQHRV